MKRIYPYILVAALVLIATTNIAHAELFEFNPTTLVVDSLANLIYSLQTIASWLIYLAGSLLNFSINLTMHIKEFVASTESVYIVWKAIRDISGMFIIFALLYAAILLIVSYEKPKFGKLIMNIVVAGVLINFSFFLTGLAIDVSNIVSLQLYNAIAPKATMDGSLGLKEYIKKSSADGGLSTIFMQSLGVTRLYNPDGSITSAGQRTLKEGNSALVSSSMKIILTGVTSIIIMITAALSFLAAALAFMVRFVILIFLLAFSPIWFASFVVPEIDEYVGKWRKYLKSQLIFMPVYLLLMYVALSVITSSSIFKEGYAGSLSNGGGFLADLMILSVNAVLIILMLNFPLLGAITMGAMVPGWAKKVGAEDIWKKVGSFTGRNTLGAAANRINESSMMRKIYASEPNLGLAVSKGLSKVSGAGFGDKKGSYDAVLKQRKKDIEALYKRVGTDENKTRGKEYQENMRTNLDKRSVFNLMLKDRANTEVADKYNKKQKKDEEIAAAEQLNKNFNLQERSIDSEIDVVTRQIDRLKTSRTQSGEQLERNKSLQVADVDRQIAANQQTIESLKKQLAEQKQKAATVMPSMAGTYKKNVQTLEASIRDQETRTADLERSKASIAAITPSNRASDEDIERLEQHLAGLKDSKRTLKAERDEANEELRKARREREQEENREKLAGSLKDSMGGSGGGDKDKGDKPKS